MTTVALIVMISAYWEISRTWLDDSE